MQAERRTEELPEGPRLPGLGFARGFRSVFEGFRSLVSQPSLWPWAAVPTLVLLLLEALFVTFAVLFVKPWVVERLPDASSWYGEVGVGVASWGLALLLSVLGWFVAVALAAPLSAPALEHIVERVERELAAPPRKPLGFWRELVCGFRSMLGALAIGLPVLGVLWGADVLFPPSAFVTLPLRVVALSLLVALSLFDYPLTLRGVGFRARLRFVRRHFSSVLGFGIAFALVFWIPCCGVALLPVGAAAATHLVWALERPWLTSV